MTTEQVLQTYLHLKGTATSHSSTPKATPFLKWAGGKRKLLGDILACAPTTFNRYLEPFLGGGAVALGLGHKEMLLNDSNPDLINAFRVVRDDLPSLVAILDEHQRDHSSEYYYYVRGLDPNRLDTIAQAGRFIYFNKTCFNGLYRVNKLGQFNVPMGRYKNPVLYDQGHLRAAAHALEGAQFFNLDYSVFLEQHARPGDFIYLDPPYVAVSKYSDFRRYTKNQFYERDHYKLAQLYNNLIELGAYPVLSNSYSDLALELYAQHDIRIVFAARAINHDGSGRGPVREILVKPARRT